MNKQKKLIVGASIVIVLGILLIMSTFILPETNNENNNKNKDVITQEDKTEKSLDSELKSILSKDDKLLKVDFMDIGDKNVIVWYSKDVSKYNNNIVKKDIKNIMIKLDDSGLQYDNLMVDVYTSKNKNKNMDNSTLKLKTIFKYKSVNKLLALKSDKAFNTNLDKEAELYKNITVSKHKGKGE